MKKKYTITILSVLIVVAATILLINKPSYAIVPSPPTNYCPDEIIVTSTTEQLSLIPGISLPKYLKLKTPSGTELPNLALTNDIQASFKEETYIKEDEFSVPIPKFSNDIYKNRYYQQLYVVLLDFLMPEEVEKIKESENGKILIEKYKELERLYNWQEKGEDLSTIVLDNIDISNLSYHAANDYLETELITPRSTAEYSYLFTHYEVKVSAPLKVVDKNGNEKSEFERGESFRLRIPKSEIKDNKINFNAKVIGKAKFDIWGEYYSEQYEKTIAVKPVLVNCGKQEEWGTFNPIEVNSNITVGNINIKVIDAESKENISNAEIVIYDEKGNEVYRYRTIGTELNITLPVGEYTVKQVVTPPNYQARVAEQKIVITENTNTSTILENIHLIEVPDTSKTISNIIIIGMIITLVGTAVIVMTIKKAKEAK